MIGRGLLGAAAAALALAPAAHAGEWLAGDLHVHTTYSHDSYGGPGDDNTGIEDANTFGFPVIGSFALAATRGLDYLAITDHQDIRSQASPDFGAFGVIPIPAYENSLDGHVQMLGATRLYPKVDDGDPAAVRDLAEALRSDGGVFQINHPVSGHIDYPHQLDWGLRHQVVPDTVEGWNGPWFYQPPFPAAGYHDGDVDFWQGFLDAGHHVAMTGASDSHWVATAAGQGPGQPTTWVYSESRDTAGVLAGLRAGHTFVAWQPPGLGGPRIFLEGDGDGDGSFEAMVGDTVPAGSPLRVTVEGAPGSLLRVYGNGGRQLGSDVLVDGLVWRRTIPVPAGTTWIRAEVALPDFRGARRALCEEQFGSQTVYCRARLLMLAMTSALYLR